MKKTIKIAHLYYDLMNLYGENGNIKALVKFIERQGLNAKVYNLTIGSQIDFNAYDFYYMGCGSEENQIMVLNDIRKYKEEISKSIESGKMYLITGNAMELFGRKIRLKNGQSYACLNLFEYQAYENERRCVSEVLYKYDKMPEGKGGNIFGFRNARCNIVHNAHRIFSFASTYHDYNFYAMNFMGPFLIRNPYFTNMLVKKLVEDKGKEYTEITDTIEFKAYQKYYENFIVNSTLE